MKLATLTSAGAARFALCCAAFVACATPAAAQSQQTSSDTSTYSYIFKKTTNNNGYEEFVRAAELIHGIDTDSVLNAGATLEQKRRVAENAACIEAFGLVKEGLQKPVASPRAAIDPETRFPELAEFRKLARVFNTMIYVDFAEGRRDAAVDVLRTGLGFAYRMQVDTLISGLVGIAMDAIVLKSFSAHVDQLSIYQCEDVLALARQLLAAENPGPRLMQREKAYITQTLESCRNDPGSLLALLSDSGMIADDDEAAMKDLKRQISSMPGSLSSIISEAESKVGSLYDATSANMLLPASKRSQLTLDSSSTPGGALFRMFAVQPQPIVDKYSGIEAQVRLLAVHTAIRKYRWDHNSLPPSLAVLHADDLTIDPFTGQSLLYKVTGDTYTLESAGPYVIDDATGKQTSRRKPVSLH